MTRTLLFVSAASIFLFPLNASAQFKLRTVETDNLKLVFYDEGHQYILPHLTRCFENSMTFHRKLFDYTPSEKVTVILRDLNDHGYAGGTSLPLNYLIIGIEPFEQVYETSPTNERINWVMSHELLHVMASDQAAPSDRFFRSLFFGKVLTTDEAPISMLYSYLTSPRMYAPRWFHEGMAVFMETWMAGGYGRVLGGYDEMVFRTMVAEDAYFYDVVGLESEGTTTDFQIGQVSYLYGTRFISYLAYQYGAEKVLRWLNRKDHSKSNFGSQFKNVYGAGLDDEWRRWITFEHEWQETALDSIRQYPVTGYRGLTERPLGSVSRAYYDPRTRKLYTGVLYPGDVSHVVEIDVDTWQNRRIADIPTPALYYVCSLAYDDSAGTIFYTTDNSKEWRDLNVVDLKTRKSRRLLKDIRVGDLALNRADKSLWGIRHHNGTTRLVMIPAPYEEPWEILPLPYGTDLFDIDVSPDGQYLSGAMMEISGRQRLIRMSIPRLLAGDSSFEVLYEFLKYSPANFVHSPDGRYLFGTTYSTGVSNVTRYDLENHKMEWITNGETGYFRPAPISEDSLIVFRYTSEGFMPVMIANAPIEDVAAVRFLGQAILDRNPVLSDWALGSPRDVEIDSLSLVPRDYDGLGSIGLESIYPIAESYRDRVAYGVRFALGDPMFTHALEATASISPRKSLPKNERFHGRVSYSHYPWALSGTVNRADFYDFFGPTKSSRKGYSVGLSYDGFISTDRPKKAGYELSITAYGDLRRLPAAQNVSASFDKLLTANGSVHYKSFRKTIGGVESEKGYRWSLNGGNNLVNGTNFPHYWGELDVGFLLPWDHSSIWLRSSAGNAHSRGDRNEPFANFFFGGFGNNYVDHGGVKRYREYYSFPGLELNELGGTNFGKLMLEWTLPPKRFRRLGIPSLYTNWAHLTLFSTAISTNLDKKVLRRNLVNFGAQLDLKLVIFSTMSSTFSLGYGAAIEESRRASHEFMISLKLL
ncbi:MAG: hypothetical protein ACE5EO_11215 [Candidatus Krumholzibacteriia bacterium]